MIFKRRPTNPRFVCSLSTLLFLCLFPVQVNILPVLRRATSEERGGVGGGGGGVEGIHPMH